MSSHEEAANNFVKTNDSSTETGTRSLVRNRIVTNARAIRWIDDNFIWVLLLLLILVASRLSDVFLTSTNLLNVLGAAVPLGLLVLAQATVFISGHFDLSTEANMIFVAILGARIMIDTSFPWPLALSIMIASSAFVGLLNGLLVAYVRINAFMVTLGVSVLLTGVALIAGRTRQLNTIPSGFRYIGRERFGDFPISAAFLFFVYACMHIVFTRTVFGRSLFAVGSNRLAARAAGLPDRRVIVSAYVISGILCALAAFILVGRLGVASAGISSGALFGSIAAAVIGGVSLFGGRGSVVGILGGLLLMGSITNALNLSSIPSEYNNIVTGLVILLAVTIDALRRRRHGEVV